MTNHTPAPWIVDSEGDIVGQLEIRGRDDFVAIGRGSEGIRISNDADLRLILAAPDMYEALSYVMDFFSRRGCPDAKMYNMARDALKKARGEV